MSEKKPKKKSQSLSLRERKFIKALAEGQPPTTAMRTAGYSAHTARWGSGKKLREPKIQEAIQKLMETNGLTDDRLLHVLAHGLEATKVMSANVTATCDGVTDAHSTTENVVEDHAVRHKYLETALKLRGYLKGKSR